MNGTVQQLAIDLIFALLFFGFATGGGGALVLLFDRMGGTWAQVVAPSAHKLASLEGLRGILAFSVVAHHAYCWYFFLQTGFWGTGRSIVFERLAGFGVHQFFFISGFLFWRKLMKRGSIPLWGFYLSRFIRIGPAYYVCIGAAIFTGLFFSGFHLQVTVGALFGSLMAWVLFSLPGRLDVNHADILGITCGVTWTLAWEWLFYLSLPFLGWFSRKSKRLVYYALTFGFLSLLGRILSSKIVHEEYLQSVSAHLTDFAWYMLIGFGGGILIATFEERIRLWLRFLLPWQNWALLGLYLVHLTMPGNQIIVAVPLLVGFALVVLGADLFGLLTCRAVRLLGLISYSLYLVHGIVYFLAMKLRGGPYPVSLLPYIAETTACLVVILLFATTIHVAIERPTMKLSEKIARRASLPPIDPVQAASAREAASWNPEQAGQGSNSGMAMHTSSM